MNANPVLPRFAVVLIWLAAVSAFLGNLQGAITISTDTTVGPSDPLLDGQEVVVQGARLTVSGVHTLQSLTVVTNGVVTHPPAPSGQAENALRLVVTGNVLIDATSRLDVSGRGYAEIGSPGYGGEGSYAGGGGGHGGRGHRSAGTAQVVGGAAFGEALSPASWGGPGGHGGRTTVLVPGGGWIALDVGGELVVAGAIRADGASGTVDNQGAGAGGTVSLRAAVLKGAGVISANGGNGEWVDGGGGAGGRIALFLGAEQFSGTVVAQGGGGAGVGGAGTVYRKPPGPTMGELTIRNSGVGEWTPVSTPERMHLVVSTNSVVYPTGRLSLGQLRVTSGATLIQAAGSTNLAVQASGDLTVEAGGVVSADGRGYPLDGDRGPGAGSRLDCCGSGAGHGGWGADGRSGVSGGKHYGSLLQPVHMGSAGGDSYAGAGAAGGGAIRLEVDGTLTVAGRISADGAAGQPDNAGGGAGGSIWITAGNVAGEGILRANGGRGEWIDGGGGAGGRLALYSGGAAFNGTLAAAGGEGFAPGGAGTIYVRNGGETVGTLRVHNGGADGNYTPLTSPEAFRVILAGRTHAYPETPLVVSRLDILGASQLTHLRGQTNLMVTVTGDLLLAADSALDADGRGYPLAGDPGPGAGQRVTCCGSGGGHGGWGGTTASGAVGGLAYGSYTEPVTMGSQGGAGAGGAGFPGGGAIRLVVSGRLTALGRISADGVGTPPDNAGGGAGGSIWIQAGLVEGNGVIRCQGGPGEWIDGGGGGGGRVALHFGTNTFSGTVSAHGGPSRRGGAGTVYWRSAGSAFGQLLIDNGGEWGNYTPLSVPEPVQLTLARNAWVFAETALTLQDLEVRTNSTLTHLPGQLRLDVRVLRDATIAGGGTLDANGRGFPGDGDRGPGGGGSTGCCGTGGGHGGVGAITAAGGIGGATYDSITQPLERGSAGGPGSGGSGGAGGGAIRLVVDRQLVLDGRIRADGDPGVADNAAGGAGGAILIQTSHLTGSGQITADGGHGEWIDGGGGAGGRIALHLGTQAFTGTMTARGLGNRPGGAGSIYTRVGQETGGLLVLDNGGNNGELSPIEVPPATRLVVGPGTFGYPVGPLSLVSLRLKSGSKLTHQTGQSLSLQVAEDLVVEEGAVITVDGRGYPVGGDPGPGAGTIAACCGGGAGHGGQGGLGRNGGVGGDGYGSVLEPVAWGSQGGAGSGGAGGAGGGAIRLVVARHLELAGTVTAGGLNGTPDNAGGGAGGSIWITAGRLSGAGTLAAHGAAGEWIDGGGGGGGRIALYLGTNDFTGTVGATGRGGYQAGGAGTVYTRVTGEAEGHLWLDNAGTPGAPTPLTSPEAFRVTVTRQAQVVPMETLVIRNFQLETNCVLTHLSGQSGLQMVALEDLIINGVAEVSGRGYPWGMDAGPGTGEQVRGAGGGAGHGGAGGISRWGAPGGPAYGSALEPFTLGSQGGPGSGGAGGAGGGAVRLFAGRTLTVNGAILANGLRGTADNSGGGSGGSLLLSCQTFSGGGSLRADGGAGEWIDGGGGAGGRIAIYRSRHEFTGTLSVAGAGGFSSGENGTLYLSEAASVVWLSPPAGWVDGQVPLQVALGGLTTTPASVTFRAARAGEATVIASLPGGLVAGTVWNTQPVPDGSWDLQVVARDNQGRVVAESVRPVLVNNSVLWHRGGLTGTETWAPGRVHVVQGDFTVASTGVLTLEPGVIVKFAPGSQLRLRSGAVLNAAGAPGQPVVLTSFADDTAGGDSNLDGAVSRPVPGAWRLALAVGAVFNQNAQTVLRYHHQTFGGTLAGSMTWAGDSLYEVTETVIVPAGATLTIQAGAIIKFAPGTGMDVQANGTLVTRGTVAQPVVFTSLRDDARGGDSNEDGTRTQPLAGDWRSLRFLDGSVGELVYAEVRYGGNSVGNPWGAGGAIEALGGPLTVRNSIIADALKDGAFCYGQTRFESCLVLRCDRGLTAVGELTAIHCTFDANRIGLLEHVGQLIVRNCIVAYSLESGIEHDMGGGVPVIAHCNVWNPTATRGNYVGVTDRTGLQGNISAAPRYRGRDADDFRLDYVSPGIDAAGGTVSPATDLAGVARFDDPRTANTGIPAANGAMPDMGAFEFVDGAPSNIDLVVEAVTGPKQLTAGSLVRVAWTIVNAGRDPFSGPWHDAVFLRPVDSELMIDVGEVLAGRGATLAPGQRLRVEADVRVPGGVNGAYRWVVTANHRGDLFESANAANNETEAASTSVLQVPELALNGSPQALEFGVRGESQWFAVKAAAGQDVRVLLDLAAEAGISELYVGRGFIPTPSRYTARQREWGSPDVSAVVDGTGSPTGPGDTNVFYVVVVAADFAEAPVLAALRATSADFSVERVRPSRVGNAGLVTLEILGSRFSSNTLFEVRSGGAGRPAVRRTVRESGRVFATFDLTGLPAGSLEVAATREGLTARLAEAASVVAGGTPDFHASLSGPSAVRAGRFATWFVTYGNRGLVDVKLPLLKFSAPGATEMQLYDNTLNWADSFTFWALHPEALLPTLGPGQEVTFEVRVKSLGNSRVTVEMMTGEQFAANPTPFNWSALPPPPGADPAAWATMVGGLDERLGATVGEYEALLEQDLADFAASELRYSYLANVNGVWLLGDEPEGLSTPRPLNPVPEDYQEPTTGAAPQGAPAAPPGDGIRKTWWVVITVEDYTTLDASDPKWLWRNLPGTWKDAQDLRDFAKKDLRTPVGQYLAYHDAPGDANEARRNTLLSLLKSLQGKVDADDNLVVAFAGHGGLKETSGAPYLAFNGDFMSPVAFTQAIDAVGAGTTYFLNDSCHSQAFNEGVNPAHTTFVGLAGTQSNKISHDTARGGELISNLKAQLRKCRNLGRAMEITTDVVTAKYQSEADEADRQQPVLTNPSGASLADKPWNDPAGLPVPLAAAFKSPPFPGLLAGATYAIVGSVDPNDKYALAGAGARRWVQAGQALPFEIVFENKTNAAAPAQEVVVIDDLDPRLDWSTFELKGIAFNDVRLTVPPGQQQFAATAMVGTDTNRVSVEVGFNAATGRVTWSLRSVDAFTGGLPEDPFAGFLPPNDASRRGEGALTYVIRARSDLADATRLTNRATIYFDPTYGVNAPIATPWVTNTVDALPPASQVESLPAAVSGPFEVRWGGADAAGSSGLASFEVYVSRDQGPYQLWQAATTATNAVFTGVPGASYRFYSVARDLAGNSEAAPGIADAVTTVAGGITYAQWAATQNLPPNANQPDDDAEGDGLTNFDEYAYATNPLVPDRALAMPRAGLTGVAGQDYLTLTYRRPRSEPTDVQYRVTWSPVLVPWAGQVVVPSTPPIDQQTHLEVPVRAPVSVGGSPQGFLKLEVLR